MSSSVSHGGLCRWCYCWDLSGGVVRIRASHPRISPHFSLDTVPHHSAPSTGGQALTSSASSLTVHRKSLSLSQATRTPPLVLSQVIFSCCFYLLTSVSPSRIIIDDKPIPILVWRWFSRPPRPSCFSPNTPSSFHQSSLAISPLP